MELKDEMIAVLKLCREQLKDLSLGYNAPATNIIRRIDEVLAKAYPNIYGIRIKTDSTLGPNEWRIEK